MLHHRSLVTALPVSVLLACGFTPGDTTIGSATSGDTDTGSTGTSGDATGGTSVGPGPTTDNPTSTSAGTTTDTATTTTTGATQGSSTGPDTSDATIYQIQGGVFPETTIVTVKGVVVTSSIETKSGIVFVQEPEGGEMSGIALYLYADVVMALDLKPGQVVDVTGEYTEFFGESQLKVTAMTDITVVSEGDPPLPEVVQPADVATGGAKAEAYEGVLVEVDDVTVTNPNIDIGEFEVTGALRISDFFLFPLMMSPKVAMDQHFDSIAGPLRFTYDNFKITPRTTADLVGMPPPSNDVSIYEIQQGMVPLMTLVTVKDAVVSTPLTFKKDGFFIQDPMGGEYSGIYVYIGANVVTVKPGDVVTVEGTYDEYFEFSEIKIADATKVMVTGSGNPPAPEVVAESDVATGGPKQENYEGVLVTVQNVQVAAVNMMFNEYETTGGLFVDPLFFAKADWKLPMVADKFMSLTGAMSFGFMEARLNPRDAMDIKP